MKKSLSFVSILVLVFGVFVLNISGQGRVKSFADSLPEYATDVKTYSEATIDDDFADGTIMVVLYGGATRSFKNYSAEDFSELNLNSVTELTFSTEELLSAERKNRGTSMEINGDAYRRILKLELAEPSKENVLEAIQLLEERTDVIYVGPDYAMKLCTTIPNDSYYLNGSQWGLNRIQAPYAWDISIGSSGVVVGVLDSGIDASHSDLTNRMYRGTPHTIQNTLHSDFTNGNRIAVLEPTDSYGHGTHVAGIIGAEVIMDLV